MKFYERLKNIWALSEFQPGKPTDEYETPGSIVSMIVKKPERHEGRFIPRIVKDPIKELVEQKA